MPELPEEHHFASLEGLLAYLREHTDDIDSIVIPIHDGVMFVGPKGDKLNMPGVGAILKFCSGRTKVIHREAAEALINDGVLQRSKIKCMLDTLIPPDDRGEA